MDTEKPTEPYYPPYCPPFYLVMCFEPTADDFIVAGIFSLAVDAERHQAHLNAKPRHAGSAHIQRLTMDQIITLLVRDRIRELAGAIDRLCGVGAGAGPRAAPRSNQSGMNATELSKHNTCSLCGKDVIAHGSTFFWRVQRERFRVDIPALDRQAFLLINSGIWTDENMAKSCGSVTLTVCDTCMSGELLRPMRP